MAKICFVSYDVLGPVRNGGIGTAITAAAQALAAQGHDVTILYPSGNSEDRSLSFWTIEFAKRNIIFTSLFSEERSLQNSYLIYQWLKDKSFDVIHFHDWRGPGYWSCIAKRQDLAFHQTTLVCQVHGQTYWHLVNSSEFLSDIAQLELDYMEQRAVELSDVVFSPSRYMLDWMAQRGWELPERVFVSPNLLPAEFRAGDCDGGAAPGERESIDEIVFFGRLEARKGVELFCAAVSRALEAGVAIRRITFLGKEGMCGPEPATAVIARWAAHWAAPYAILNDLDVAGARRYLSKPGRLAVVASTIENSPYSVLESLAAARPFVAADVGGVAELIAPQDCADALFPRNVQALSDKLADVVSRGALIARPVVEPDAARARWLEWHETLQAGPERVDRVRVQARSPLVSVCISHFSRPHFLKLAVESIETQTYSRVQLVLVDDASPDEASRAYLDQQEARFRDRGWKIIRNATEIWTGAARNLAVSQADGEYVLLMDDDNVARPEEIEVFVTAALATGADAFTCQMQPFGGEGGPPAGKAELPIGWMALGPNLSQALFQNCVGDLNVMVKRSVWNELGGFTTDRYGCEDWEFLVKLIMRGYRLEAVPEILFFYRHSKSGLGYRYGPEALYKSMIRPLRPVLDAVRPDLHMALRFAVESRLQGVGANRTGYWADRPPRNSISARIASLPANTGEALVEMAIAALRRGQNESAALLYEQALRNAPSNYTPHLDAATRSKDG